MTSVLKRVLAAGVFAAGLISVAASAQATQYPLEIQNCGRTITFDHAPERVVSLGQSNTEILYLLGLSSSVVGTAVWFDPVMAQFADENAKIPRLADNDPSFESVVGQRPDMVTTQFQWHVGPSGIVGTTAQFDELGIPVYTAPADCVGKDNTTGGDGTRIDAFSMDRIYQSITDLSRIFDVEDRGTKLIADLKQREQAARQDVAGLAHNDVSAVFWFSSSELHADPYVGGQKGAPGYISSVLGIKNVIQSDDEWPTVGWETIARADPDIIVIAKMDRRRFPADDWELKMNFLKTDPVASQMKAVKNGHVVVMEVLAMDPTIRTIDGIEQLAKAIKSFGLDK
ncbi:ABC transporter substrate-binding protein [Thalassospira marina]|uniref:ABC transporter substrate-binding protein n=1 Tax=Thalassospira marina TaxID=2048283 RepID=A0ABM6Q6W4_9PROT|nr:ABC transporter substrate-binding protein [Thalassospira marina]AUG51854.1 ABC transporter substrate-binding protein [Thalassospira marina]